MVVCVEEGHDTIIRKREPTDNQDLNHVLAMVCLEECSTFRVRLSHWYLLVRIVTTIVGPLRMSFASVATQVAAFRNIETAQMKPSLFHGRCRYSDFHVREAATELRSKDGRVLAQGKVDILTESALLIGSL